MEHFYVTQRGAAGGGRREKAQISFFDIKIYIFNKFYV